LIARDASNLGPRKEKPGSAMQLHSARSIGVENANDAGEVACNKPEAQAKGIE